MKGWGMGVIGIASVPLFLWTAGTSKAAVFSLVKKVGFMSNCGLLLVNGAVTQMGGFL